jgi:hypothetical protein
MKLTPTHTAALLLLVTTSPLAAQALTSGDRTLSFPAGSGGRGLSIVASDGNQTSALSTQPVSLFVCGPCTDEKSTQTPLAIGYGSVQAQPNGTVLAQAAVRSPAGSLFKVSDVYAAGVRSGTFTVARSVIVATANAADQGFNSQFTLGFNKPLDIHRYHFLAPSVWYDHNENAGPQAFAADYADSAFYWRETRSALPFVMIQDPGTGTTLSIGHTAGVPSTGIDETTKTWVVDASVQNGSLGVQKLPQLELGFIYPADEIGQGTGKASGSTWVRRSHPVQAGFTQAYTLMLDLGNGVDGTGTASYAAGLRQTWRTYYAAFAPKARFIPSEIVYRNQISLVKLYSQDRNGAQGEPFGVRVDGTDERDSYQMGYTGDQIPVGFQLFRYGVLNDDTTALSEGQATLDFWAYKAGQPSGLPLTWYNVTPPTFRNSSCKYPLYMRSLSDGMESMASAAIFARQHSMPHPAWESFSQAFGDFLVSHQNADGSFYRAFNPDGSVYTNEDPDCTPGTYGDSKLNTTFPVRFLVELYVGTGDQKYLQAALSAGNYALTAIYGPTQYVGGTTKPYPSLEKEAAEQAIHAGLALYDVTRDPKWLAAARQAADFAETFAYAFPFVVNDPLPAFKTTAPFGFSLSGTSSDSAGLQQSFESYDYYRLFVFSGFRDLHELEFAAFVQASTKYTTQLGGTQQQYGYAHNGFAGEATTVAYLAYKGDASSASESWLPWLSDAELDPLQRMKDTFGSFDILDAEAQSRAQLQSENLHIYPAPGSIGWGKVPGSR